jgi:hypothetical protein
MAQLKSGELLVDKNGVTWRVALDDSRVNIVWRVTVPQDSARTYDMSAAGESEEPEIIKAAAGPDAFTTTEEMQAEVDRFATLAKGNLVLRVRASPDPKPAGMGAGLFIALLVLVALAESGKRRR